MVLVWGYLRRLLTRCRRRSPAGETQLQMAEPSLVASISTFVVRFWREWSIVGSRWRGRIEHVESGESVAFVDVGAMLDFLRRLGVVPSGRSEAASNEQ